MSLWIAKEQYDVWLMNEKPSFDGLNQINQTKLSHASTAAVTLISKRLVAAAGIDLKPGECVEVQLVRVAERRTPSTGLPPVCDGAAAMKIDPPGAVAEPHAVVVDRYQYEALPTPSQVAANVEDERDELLAKVTELKEEIAKRPNVSTAGFAPQDRPIPAIRLARLIADLADEQDDEAMSWTDGLRALAERIAHPLRLGEHG